MMRRGLVVLIVLFSLHNMKYLTKIWPIKKLIEVQEKINPKPQYQRTPVWNLSKRILLIDSILRRYDLPKFYIKKTDIDPNYSFEVIDGQQRMRAIWEFYNSVFILKGENVKNSCYYDMDFNHLPDEVKDDFMNYKLSISIIEDASQEEIRALFARLQMGMTLIPVELRHALASNIGTALFSITENNKFFQSNCGILNKRFKHQDYVDHVMALMYYNNTYDLKAPTLYQLYLDLSNAKNSNFLEHLRKMNNILNWMYEINNYSKGIFKNKWGFIDNYWLLYKNFDIIKDVNCENYAENLYEFELKRKIYNPKQEELIEDKESINYDKDLYDYIEAFNRQGGLKKNISIRYRVLNNKLNNKLNFKYIEDA